jgi:pilus assembly protein CpaE
MEEKSLNLKDIVVGIIAPSTESRDLLQNQLQASAYPSSIIISDQYCVEKTDWATHRFLEAHPNIIVVDMENPQEALSTLRILHDVLPKTWLFASSEVNEPQLIIDTMRAGAREFLSKPINNDALKQALSRYHAEQKKQAEPKSRGKIYCFTSAKGGAGTTSIAVNLAVSLATAKNTKVALIDLGSPLGDAAEYLNLKPKFSVADAIASVHRMDPVLLESFMTRAHGVAVLSGFKDFHPPGMQPEELKKLMHVAAETYTHVIIDTFCSYQEELLRVLTEYSEGILLVLTPELPALWRTGSLLRFFDRIGAQDKTRLVVNRAGKRHVIEGKEIEKVLKLPIYWNLPNNYPASIQAVNSGKPLVTMNQSALAASYGELAQALTGVPLRTKQRGLFNWLS